MKIHLFRFLAVCMLSASFFTSYSQSADTYATTTTNCNDPNGGCDTIQIVKKISPWRIGLFAGPAVAYCGSWENTFVSDKLRDKSLFNGVGFNAAFNADYYFNKSDSSRFKFGLGAMAGIQNFFLRKDVNTFLDQRFIEAGVRNGVVQKAPSEDLYLVVGPVLTFSFTRKARSPYLEASIRGGAFRTTPAAIFAYDGTTGRNIYSVTASNKRYYPGLLTTLGFFVPSKNNLWAWGIEAIGFRTKVDYIFPGETIYPFTRNHGGFSAGLAVRRKFEKDVWERKDPTPPIFCVAPSIELKMNNKSIKAQNFNWLKDSTMSGPVVLSWKSGSGAEIDTTEKFTASIHRLYNGNDSIIAQVICATDTMLAWPEKYMDQTNGRPVTGQYYVRVQSNRISTCSSCISEASVTGFAVRDSVVVTPPKLCLMQCDLVVYGYERVRKGNRIKYGKSPESCENCICPIDTVARYVSEYRPLGTMQLEDCDPTYLNIRDEVLKQNIKPKSGIKTIYVKVKSTVVGDCNIPSGVTEKNYKATVTKGVIGVFQEVKQ